MKTPLCSAGAEDAPPPGGEGDLHAVLDAALERSHSVPEMFGAPATVREHAA